VQSPEEQFITATVRLFRKACHAVAFTGAGMSTASGIPDFRSRGTGLWEHADPMEVASLAGFRRKPEAFYEWIRPLAQRMFMAEPNPGHHALAALERAGFLAALITQNIDQLHRRAGSQRMFELHGDIGAASLPELWPHLRERPVQGAIAPRGNGIADLCAMPERAETRCHPVWRDTSGKDNAGGTTGGAALRPYAGGWFLAASIPGRRPARHGSPKRRSADHHQP
jgi:hypothetical protein